MEELHLLCRYLCRCQIAGYSSASFPAQGSPDGWNVGAQVAGPVEQHETFGYMKPNLKAVKICMSLSLSWALKGNFEPFGRS